MAQEQQGSLVRLKDADLTVNPDEDIRGRKVLDPDGEDIGTVDALLVDEADRRVRFLEVGSGGFLGIGEKKRLIPVDAITGIGDEVRVDVTRQTIAGGPAYDPEVLEYSPDYYGELYGYYGYAPYWMPGYVYPYPVR